jgi:hypothetical protein
MTSFIAIDGEADNKGNYIILCDSLGRVLYNPKGITTQEAFGFLLCLPRKHEIVCYGLNYDANQWIRELPRAQLERLASENRCAYQNYKLEWIPSKTFKVTVPQKSVTVCEVFGFFQTSFIKALEQWGIELPAEIETMKRRRGTFSQKEIQRIISYCQHECRLLVQIMERLQDACNTAGCAPRRRWIGAGSIASSLLTREGAKRHHAYDVDLFGGATTDDYVLRAYYGGRVELHRQGWTAKVTASDVRSAYPAAAMRLPSLADATVIPVTRYQPFEPYALWRVKWAIGNSHWQIAPFPVRLPSGQICYPLKGDGVYHASEVAMALRLGFPVDVLDGVVLRPAGEETPFDWIQDVYEHRARFKREGSYAEKALKLGLNSVYGKFAQGYGFGRRPPFQSYYWAGFITAATRARVLEALTRAISPVMVATDGVVCSKDTTPVAQDRLGGWELTPYHKVATVQPGVYMVDGPDGRFVKSRGFFARDVDYDAMLDQFVTHPLSAYHFTSRRFIGLKVALHRKDFSVWRTWPNERRSIAFEIQNKRRVQDGETVTLYPIAGPYSSLPYVPKQSLYDDPTDESLENMVRDDQPHREVD